MLDQHASHRGFNARPAGPLLSRCLAMYSSIRRRQARARTILGASITVHRAGGCGTVQSSAAPPPTPHMHATLRSRAGLRTKLSTPRHAMLRYATPPPATYRRAAATCAVHAGAPKRQVGTETPRWYLSTQLSGRRARGRRCLF
jgi:hypothetical protein